MSHRSFLVAVILTCALVSPSVPADIYIQQDESEEIHLSNIPGMEGFVTLVEDMISPDSAPAAETPRTTSTALPFDPAVQVAAKETGLEPALIHAVIATESGHNPQAISPKGARGLMQLMPATARALHVENPGDPAQNILGGARYLRTLIDDFGSVELALAAYNAGPGRVRTAGNRMPNIRETRLYVPRVMQQYQRLKKS
jgi:soluble lytic murein transglycosylase-like protein